MDLLGIPSIDAPRGLHKTWMQEAPGRVERARKGKRTESPAVGSWNFVEIIKAELGIKAKGRRISGADDQSGLREPDTSNSNDFEANDGLLSTKIPLCGKLISK